MRAISSRTLVGELLPPMNWKPLVGFGKMPAASSDVALGSIMHDGIVLPGNGWPGTTPVGGAPPGQPAPSPATPVGTEITRGFPLASVVGNTAPVPGPFASGYELASGTV